KGTTSSIWLLVVFYFSFSFLFSGKAFHDPEYSLFSPQLPRKRFVSTPYIMEEVQLRYGSGITQIQMQQYEMICEYLNIAQT
ncbi:hypothetical protein, partial [Bacteroides heparinolyticus]|uniref:hypothetical protein n=1 Tax=Prevotella heparinolytica TaxID=28113 RepID=UPI0035A028AD